MGVNVPVEQDYLWLCFANVFTIVCNALAQTHQ